MPRQLRLEYAGAIYHLMSRGHRREIIFRDKPDRERFLQALAETCAKTGWEVHAWCLMSNHFHLIVETPQPNLVSGMKWLLVRRGWCFGEKAFREELLAQVREKVGPSHDGRERQEAAEEKAKRIVREELKRLGWGGVELGRRRKGDLEKVRIARQFVAVGLIGLAEGARIMVSSDAAHWDTTGLDGSWTVLNAVTFGNGRFVAVGCNGTIVETPSIIQLTVAPEPSPGLVSLFVEGSSGMDFSIESSTDLVSWRDVTRVTNAASSELLFRAIPAASNRSFFRARTP